MPDRLQEIRARLDAATPGPWKRSLSGSHHNPWKVHRGAILVALSGESPEDADLIAHAPADIAWLLDEVERLRDKMARNMPWWRRDADGSLWVAPPTVGGEPEPDSHKWVRVQ